jgi:hypothetical protein
MERVRTAVTAVLLALLTALAAAAPAVAQDRPAEQQAVYGDFEDDGFLDACEHDQETLQAALDGIEAETDADTPDFRPKVEAALAEVQAGSCADEEEDLAAGGTADDTTSGVATPAPEEEPAGSGDSSGPPTAADVDPLPPEPTPVPAATPVPTAVPVAPAGTPSVAYRNEDDAVPVALLALAGLLGALALLALAYALLSRIAWVDERLAGPRRASREAGFRAGGAWGDFTDWLRLGR